MGQKLITLNVCYRDEKKAVCFASGSPRTDIEEAIRLAFELPAGSPILCKNNAGAYTAISSALPNGYELVVQKPKLEAAQDILIYLESPDGRVVSLETRSSVKVGQIKERIEKELDEPIRVEHCGVELKDGKTLGECGVKDKSTLNVKILIPYLLVHTLTGKRLIISFEQSETVEHLKARIQDKVGMAPKDQRLVFAGKQLEDNKTLADYNMTSGSSIHIVLRLRGC